MARETDIGGKTTIAGPVFTYNLTLSDMRESIWKRWNYAKLSISRARWLLDVDLGCRR
ncbi:hypothetical protein K469DRAFT_63642 [Zopfia rhizophila CBS 207.26]|uniref:Uncharacterized protein n=1 Tax=Zopfia rhizophila CBS 207.26 TaxID=1314779 RepID=A0A6A6EDP3_9PEZI|nr:hypothetical protein K469DRAFT_63642 [Zopfia rhizophila CBS 207.26]